MALPPLTAMLAADQRGSVLGYLWDDTRASDEFRTDASALVERAAALSLRARVALGVTIYEWIVWRFSAISDNPLPSQIAEAAWCACIDRRHMDYLELDRNAWLGPVRGPLWCATTWLLPMVFFSDEEPEEWRAGLDYLIRLARHVLPFPVPFEQWLNASLIRLAGLYPAPPEDLFGEHEEERRGPPVPREALDPDLPFNAADTDRLIALLLAQARADGNPRMPGTQRTS